jgi:hypothetical protein
MSGTNGASFDHLIGQIDRRLANIERDIERLVDSHDDRHDKLNHRVRDLESTRSETRGGWTVLSVVGTVAGALGGYASRWLGG